MSPKKKLDSALVRNELVIPRIPFGRGYDSIDRNEVLKRIDYI